MKESGDRIIHVSGTAREVGYAIGQRMGGRLAGLIDRYIQNGPARFHRIDIDRLRRDALPWLGSLPPRFQEEIEGLARGSDLPLQRVAEWCFVEELTGCSALIARLNGRLWLARNNDIWAPDLWGYVTIKEVRGRIPTINLGMEGEPFTATGINRERLWMHYNFLPTRDFPTRTAWQPFVLLTDMLETCSSLREVDKRLRSTQRTGSMMVFAVDGKTDQGAVFECTCTQVNRRSLTHGRMTGTNHYTIIPGFNGADEYTRRSQRRLNRMNGLLDDVILRNTPDGLPGSLIGILADPAIEGRGMDSGTAYSAVACPAEGALWFTLGGYPAASLGAWERIRWPWM